MTLRVCVCVCVCAFNFLIQSEAVFSKCLYNTTDWYKGCGVEESRGGRKRWEKKWQEESDDGRTYPPSDVCGSVWWSVCGWACLVECVSEGGRGWDWAPLRVSDKDGASRTLSAGYSCITAPSWAPSLLQDWQLQWKILSTSLSTRGDSSLPGHSRVTCSHTHTSKYTHTHTYVHTQRVEWFGFTSGSTKSIQSHFIRIGTELCLAL